MKKQILLPLIMAAAVLFLACGEDNKSSAAIETDYAYDESGSLVVYPEQQMYVTTVVRSEDVCTVDTAAGVYLWQHILKRPDVDSMYYEFHGDTLVTYQVYLTYDYPDGDPDSQIELVEKKERYGDMYIGGTPNLLYGTWKTLPCEYNSETMETECEETFWSAEVTYAENTYSAKYQSSFERYKAIYVADNYMKSEFMAELYKGLSSNYGCCGWGDVTDKYDEERLAGIIAEKGIVIQSQTPTSETFVLGGKTYNVLVKQVSYEMYGQSYAVDVSSDGVTCSWFNHDEEVREPLCKAENKDKLSLDYSYDVNGNRYDYAYEYRETNFAEFRRCLDSIKLGLENPDNMGLYKKSTVEDFPQTFKDRREKQLRRLMKYAE